MSSVDKVNDALIEWLALRLERANYVEKQLGILIKKKEMTDSELKRYANLTLDAKNLSVKDIVSIYEALGNQSESVGFEDFE